ncbi:DUF3331 domain-containing protein [Paraburkholderia sp. BCC1886]|uniref:DUF3331 domain-containing protein n=1 Tax=Paraburkholderia sp. BCC1886 TaxID=2562670 RepID=UPI0011820B50|nr:DUF3331 domain-containing protein [Paraburkholderia sp. BCC1886]
MHIEMQSNVCSAPPALEGSVAPATAAGVTERAGGPVWGHVISALLCAYRVPANPPPAARPVGRAALRAPSSHVLVEVVERLSVSTIAVIWQDATRCCYIDQVWHSCRARSMGYCALTGTLIRRGDFIYKPRVRGEIPANADAMIVASAIAQAGAE